MKGLNKKENLIDTNKYDDYQRKGGWGEVAEGVWEINADGRRPDLE